MDFQVRTNSFQSFEFLKKYEMKDQEESLDFFDVDKRMEALQNDFLSETSAALRSVYDSRW